MQNPIITRARIEKAGGCSVAKRKFSKYFGAEARISLAKAAEILVRKGTRNALYDLSWGIVVFGRPSKEDAKKALKEVTSSTNTVYKLKEAIAAFKEAQHPSSSPARVIEYALQNNPVGVYQALFVNPSSSTSI